MHVCQHERFKTLTRWGPQLSQTAKVTNEVTFNANQFFLDQLVQQHMVNILSMFCIGKDKGWLIKKTNTPHSPQQQQI